jgi:hypothetical protein
MPDEKVGSIRNVANLAGPVFTCRLCGESFQYTPMLMPSTRPFPVTSRPGFMDFKSMYACIECVEKQLHILKEKIKRGEMFPLQVWDGLHIVDAQYRTDRGLVQSGDVFPDGHFVKESDNAIHNIGHRSRSDGPKG